MSCPILRERLTFYAENLLDEADRRLVEDHLKSCESCRITLSEILSIRKLLREMGPLGLPSAAVEETAARLQKVGAGPQRRRPAAVRPLPARRWPSLGHPAVIGLLAAAVLLVAVLWGLGTFDDSAVPPSGTQARAQQEVDFYLQEHALSTDQGMLPGDDFSWLVVAENGNREE